MTIQLNIISVQCSAFLRTRISFLFLSRNHSKRVMRKACNAQVERNEIRCSFPLIFQCKRLFNKLLLLSLLNIRSLQRVRCAVCATGIRMQMITHWPRACVCALCGNVENNYSASVNLNFKLETREKVYVCWHESKSNRERSRKNIHQ